MAGYDRSKRGGRVTPEPAPSTTMDPRTREALVRHQLEVLGMSLDRNRHHSGSNTNTNNTGLVHLGAGPSTSKAPPPAVPSLRRSNSSRTPSTNLSRTRSPVPPPAGGQAARSATNASVPAARPRHTLSTAGTTRPESAFDFDWDGPTASLELGLNDPRYQRRTDLGSRGSLDLLSRSAPVSDNWDGRPGPAVPRTNPARSNGVPTPRGGSDRLLRTPTFNAGAPLTTQSSSPLPTMHSGESLAARPAPLIIPDGRGGQEQGQSEARWLSNQAQQPSSASRAQMLPPAPPAAGTGPRRSASVRVPPRVRNTSISLGSKDSSGNGNGRKGLLSSLLRGQGSSSSSSSSNNSPTSSSASHGHGHRAQSPSNASSAMPGDRKRPSPLAAPEPSQVQLASQPVAPQQPRSPRFPDADVLNARIQDYLAVNTDRRPLAITVPDEVGLSAGDDAMEMLASPMDVQLPLTPPSEANGGLPERLPRMSEEANREVASTASNASFATASENASPSMSRSSSQPTNPQSTSSSQHSLASQRSTRPAAKDASTLVTPTAERIRASREEPLEEPRRREGKQRKRLSMLEFLGGDAPAESGDRATSRTSSPRASLDRRSLVSPSPLLPSDKPNFARAPSPLHLPAGSEPSTPSASLAREPKPAPAVPSLVKNKAKQRESVAFIHPPSLAPATPPPSDNWSIDIAVKPLSDSVTMFGTTHTTTKYSLSGSVVLSISRVRRYDLPRVPSPKPNADKHSRSQSTQVTRSPITPYPTHRVNASVSSSGGGTPPPLPPKSSAPLVTVSEPPAESEDLAIYISSLTVTFTGYSIYFDPSGRFAGLKLADITQQLLPEGASVPIKFDPTSQDPIRYEAEFDMAIPGCLPASLKCPFGATFYTLSSNMSYIEGDKPGAASPTRSPPNSAATPMGMPAARTSSAVSFDIERDRADLVDAFGSTSDPRGRPKSGWLGKISRQRSLRSSGPGSGASQGSTTDRAEARRPRPVRSQSGTVLSADGLVKLSSANSVIIIRRCRDVVPVPMARMAREDLVGIPTDPPPQSSRRGVPQRTSSIGDLAGQAGTRAAATSERTPQSMQVPSELNPAASSQTLRADGQRSSEPKPPVLFGRQSSLPDGLAAMGAPDARHEESSGPAPMRHFLHRPVLHPPIDVGGDSKGLPFILTVSVPTHVHSNSDTLNFGIQADLGPHDGWATVRRLGGLRLRYMDLVCSQSERHR